MCVVERDARAHTHARTNADTRGVNVNAMQGTKESCGGSSKFSKKTQKQSLKGLLTTSVSIPYVRAGPHYLSLLAFGIGKGLAMGAWGPSGWI